MLNVKRRGIEGCRGEGERSRENSAGLLSSLGRADAGGARGSEWSWGEVAGRRGWITDDPCVSGG